MKDLRLAVVRLFNKGKSKAEISRLLNVPVSTVKRDIKRFNETWNNNDRPGRGRKKIANTATNQKKIKKLISKNPRLSTRKLAKSTEISRSTIRRILKHKLQLKPYKLKQAHLLNDEMKAIRVDRCKALLQRFSANSHRSILFSDGKLFTIEQAHNNQNDRIWSKEAPSFQDRVVARSHTPKSVMVWAGITHWKNSTNLH